MTLTAILILLAIGFLLVVLEIFVLPGIIVGIIGGGLIITSIVLAYINLGTEISHKLLLSTAIVSIVLAYFAFRPATWKKVSLETMVDGKMNTINNINKGDEGVTSSKLSTSGNAVINDVTVEVHSESGYIAENTPIIVHRVEQNKIWVKQKTT